MCGVGVLVTIADDMDPAFPHIYFKNRIPRALLEYEVTQDFHHQLYHPTASQVSAPSSPSPLEPQHAPSPHSAEHLDTYIYTYLSLSYII